MEKEKLTTISIKPSTKKRLDTLKWDRNQTNEAILLLLLEGRLDELKRIRQQIEAINPMGRFLYILLFYGQNRPFCAFSEVLA